MTQKLITIKNTSGRTLSAFYQGSRVLFMPKSRHRAFYARVAELEAVAAFAEVSLLWFMHNAELKAKRARLATWLNKQRDLWSEATQELQTAEDAVFAQIARTLGRHDRVDVPVQRWRSEGMPVPEFPYPFNFVPKGSV